jgi:hypothetical protein
LSLVGLAPHCPGTRVNGRVNGQLSAVSLVGLAPRDKHPVALPPHDTRDGGGTQLLQLPHILQLLLQLPHILQLPLQLLHILQLPLLLQQLLLQLLLQQLQLLFNRSAPLVCVRL